MKPHDKKLDIAKLIASLLVVQGHLLNAVKGSEVAADHVYMGIYMCHMPAFYFISGLLAFKSGKKYTPGELLKQKAVTLAFPYVIWSTVSFFFSVTLSALKGGISAELLKNEAVDIFFYGRSVWFLIQLFFAFAILSICLKLGKSRRAFYMVSVVGYILLLIILPDGPFSFYKLKWLYPFFLVGYAVADLFEECVILRKDIRNIAVGLFSCLFPVLTCLFNNGERYQRYMKFAYESVPDFFEGVGCYLISAAGIALIFTVAAVLAKTQCADLFAEIGTYSLDIYVAHMFFVKFFLFIPVMREMKGAAVDGILFLIAGIIVVVLWFGAKHLLRKSKLYRISVGLYPQGKWVARILEGYLENEDKITDKVKKENDLHMTKKARTLQTAIITGPTGTIGIALCQRLLDAGMTVYAVVRADSERAKELPKSERLYTVFCNVEDLAVLNEKIDTPVDAFFHLAWGGTIGEGRNDAELQLQNVEYAVQAVWTAAKLGCRIFVGAGSQAEYGRVDGMLCPDTPCFPETGYGIAKLCAGQMSRLECEKLGIEHIWARILSVYGPHDGPLTMITGTIRTLLRGERPKLTSGEQRWDYLYAADAAEALYRMALHGRNGAVYPLGSGQAYSLRSYVEILRDTIDPALELGFGEVPYGDRQVMCLQADISDLRRDTGFEPKVSFAEGIKETIAWMKGRA